MGSDWLRKCRSNTSYADNAHAPASGDGPASRPPLSSRMAHPVVSDVLRCIAVLAGALFGTSAAVGQAPSSRDTAEAAIWRLVIAQDSAERPIVSRTFATPRFICGPFRSPSCEVDSLPVAFQSAMRDLDGRRRDSTATPHAILTLAGVDRQDTVPSGDRCRGRPLVSIRVLAGALRGRDLPHRG